MPNEFVRQFYFRNEKNEIFDLMGHYTDFLNSPSGLGYQINLILSQLSKRLKIDQIEYEFQEVTGEMLFKEYQDYEAFTDFITKAETLYLHYKVPARHGNAYIECFVTNIDKGEKDYQTSYLTCPITIKPLTLWSIPRTKPFSFIDDGGGSGDYKKFPYTFPFTLGSNEGGSSNRTNQLEIRNEGVIKTPLIIKFRGSAIRPEWYLNINNKFNSGLLSLTIQPNQLVTIDSTEGRMKTYSGGVLLDKYLAIDRRNYLDLNLGINQLFLTNILEGEVNYVEYYLTI